MKIIIVTESHANLDYDYEHEHHRVEHEGKIKKVTTLNQDLTEFVSDQTYDNWYIATLYLTPFAVYLFVHAIREIRVKEITKHEMGAR